MPVCPQCRKENPELGAKCPRCADSFYVYEDSVDDAENDPYIGEKAADKYVVIARISEGGMGTVYRALQLPVEREVAFKVLRTELEDNDEVRNRFTREARAVSKINHPNIITLHDFGFDESDYPYMVMEYAPGQNLEDWIYQDGLTLARIVHVMRQILSALADAHEQGIVHRDLKPENIVVTGTGTDDDFIKLLDFGIARLVNEQATEGLTREGEVFGTPHYMSPEQAEGETGIGPPADVYAAGIMMYEMLCKTEPFDAPKPLSILFKQINEELPEIEPRRGLEISDDLEQVVRRATQKSPDDRFATAGDMLDALERATQDPDASGIMPAPEAPSAADGDSDTILGTGASPALDDAETREEHATAETLGFEDDEGGEDASERLAPKESNEVAVDTPALDTADFEDEDWGASRTKVAAILAVGLLMVGGFTALMILGGDEEEAVAADGREAVDAAGTTASAGAAPGESTAGADTGTAFNSADGGGVDAGLDADASPESDATDGTTSSKPTAERDESPPADDPESSGGRAGSDEPESGAGAVGSSGTSGRESQKFEGPEEDPSETETPSTESEPSGGSKTATKESPTGAGDETPSEPTEDEGGEKGDETESSEEIEKFGAPEKDPSDSADDSSGPTKFGAPE